MGNQSPAPSEHTAGGSLDEKHSPASPELQSQKKAGLFSRKEKDAEKEVEKDLVKVAEAASKEKQVTPVSFTDLFR